MLLRKVRLAMNYIDLFSGAGGFSLGFDRAGFKNVFALDINKEWCLTYQNNFPGHSIICDDIKNIKKEEVQKLIKGKRVDVIIGGPPCQGFSMAGNIGRNFIDDERNYLFKEFARVISLVKPKYFVMENVARLYTHNKGKTKEEVLKAFRKLGYKIEGRILNAADYGVPQLRSRVIFIGNNAGKMIRFPKITSFDYKIVKDAIDDLPPLLSGEKSSIPNHEAMNHSLQMLEKMSHVRDGGNRCHIPVEIRPTSGDARKYIRYNSQKPSFCVTGDMRKVFHYSQNRALTVRELARLQSFPDQFIIYGSKISQQQQVGNAVPLKLAFAIAKSIIEMDKNESS